MTYSSGHQELQIFLSLVTDLYQEFLKIMESGTPQQKKEAIEKFQEMQMIIREKLSEFQKKQGFDFTEIEKLLEERGGEASRKFQEVKETFLDYQQRLKPYQKKEKLTKRRRIAKRIEGKG